MSGPFKEKLLTTVISACLASLAGFWADDAAVRQLLFALAAGPAFAVLYPRAEERQLRKQLRDSLAPPPDADV